MRKLIGRHIVADPDICHGKPTFRGTRIMVADVLDQVASGMAWQSIIAEWRGNISQDAIAEAVRLARQEHARELELSEAWGVNVLATGLSVWRAHSHQESRFSWRE